MEEITVDLLKKYGFGDYRPGSEFLWFMPCKGGAYPYIETYVQFDFTEHLVIEGKEVYKGVRNFVQIGSVKCYTLDELKEAVKSAFGFELKTEYKLN